MRKAWDSFRPRTNADIRTPPGAPPSRELVFLGASPADGNSSRANHQGTAEESRTPTGDGGHHTHKEEECPVRVPCVRSTNEPLVDAHTRAVSAPATDTPIMMGNTREATKVATGHQELVGEGGGHGEKVREKYCEGRPQKGVVIASVRAGDWVRLETCGVVGSKQVTGWVRVEAVSVGCVFLTNI